MFFDIEDVLCVDEMWTVSLFGSIFHKYKTHPPEVEFREFCSESGSRIEKNLPPGWEMLQDEEGNTYFYHEDSGKTSWERPQMRNVANVALAAARWAFFWAMSSAGIVFPMRNWKRQQT